MTLTGSTGTEGSTLWKRDPLVDARARSATPTLPWSLIMRQVPQRQVSTLL